MPTIEIDYTTLQGKIVTHLANAQGKTAKEYIEYVLTQHCLGQVNGYFLKKFNDLSLNDKIDLFGDII